MFDAIASPVRLQKYLAQQGLGSRRTIETWITAGLIHVNGKIAKLGDKITGQDHICVKGRPIKYQSLEQATSEILLYHKPVGEVCTRQDEQDRRTVFKALPVLKTGRWINIGRLDLNTSGLLLFTNQGDLANRCMHPKFGLLREYAVRVLGHLSESQLAILRQGVTLDSAQARFETIQHTGGRGANHWYQVGLKEGRNRLVRRLFETQKATVSRLIRIGFGGIALPRSLKPGDYQRLSQIQVKRFLRTLR